MILVQNVVEEDLKVKLIVPTSVEDYKKEVLIPKLQIKEVWVSSMLLDIMYYFFFDIIGEVMMVS